MSNPIGPIPWWRQLLAVVPKVYRFRDGIFLTWLGGIFVLRKPRG